MLAFRICIIITACYGLLGCQQNESLFKEVPATVSGINFSNNIQESASLNIINYQYLYNGGGVGIGDFNHDQLPDIFFSGNQVSNQLYINQGKLNFKEVGQEAGVAGNGNWARGVTVVDINQDGWQDIYVCHAFYRDPQKRRNQLYVNQPQLQKNGMPVFQEMAAAYGLDDTSHTQMANFFDYDNDGDLDVYLLVNELSEQFPGEYRPIKTDGSSFNTDRLLRNDWDATAKHAVYTNVSAAAGITWEGYGLGVQIADINEDGWKDIYVSNDYLSTNLLYINNKNGTFSNQYDRYFKHSSLNAMGNDIADVNNDGLLDIIEMDMAAEDNHRLKMMMNNIDYQTLLAYQYYGYNTQVVRNTLQINQGRTILRNDSLGTPFFSEVGNYAGIARTDWSWSPLLVDVDNDGWRDLLVSNGFPKDITDQDFIAYRRQTQPSTPKDQVLAQIPTVKVSNYIFKNNGNCSFKDQSIEWGWNTPTFSAGMAYADLDNDGDMDVVCNNTNMPASLLENRSNQQKENKTHALRLKLVGLPGNLDAIGAVVKVYFKGNQQVHENTPYRGYQSTVESILHVGLGNNVLADSVIVHWQNGTIGRWNQVKADEVITLQQSKNAESVQKLLPQLAQQNWFTDITNQLGGEWVHVEKDFIDFNVQKLLPHKFSTGGPALAVGDLNADGKDDIVMGSAYPGATQVLLQQSNGRFKSTALKIGNKQADDMGICLFDADGDADLDIYIAAGGYENPDGAPAYADHFFMNEGGGKFSDQSAGLPHLYASKSAVRAMDIDGDSRIDLVLGGRVHPGKFPAPESIYVLKNTSVNGKVSFALSKELSPDSENLGLITDMLCTDMDDDGDEDILVVGEWMAPIWLVHEKGKLLKRNLEANQPLTGWWNSVAAGDFDNDGDQDYVLGNAGTNSFFKASMQEPVSIYGGDFDANGSYDAIMSTYIPTQVHGLNKKDYPAFNREEMIKEMSVMKSRFTTHAAFAAADIKAVLLEPEIRKALFLQAVELSSVWLENRGKEQLLVHVLPYQAQWAPIFGIVADDFNGDGNTDIALSGNDFATPAVLGYTDALNGLVLKGDGKGGFMPLAIAEGGIFIPGSGKALVQLEVNGKPAIAAGQNDGLFKVFIRKQNEFLAIPFLPNEQYALITQNGRTRKIPANVSAYLSQSGRKTWVPLNTQKIIVVNGKKEKRILR